MRATLPIRGLDKHGSGYYGAPRGSRVHNGIDYACPPESEIHPTCPGKVSKHGWAYSDPKKSDYRYVQVTDVQGYNHRYFYIDAAVDLGVYVTEETVIGTAQDLTKIYPGITNHVHYEIKKEGDYFDPEKFFD